MGLVNGLISLSNPRNHDLKPVEVGFGRHSFYFFFAGGADDPGGCCGLILINLSAAHFDLTYAGTAASIHSGTRE